MRDRWKFNHSIVLSLNDSARAKNRPRTSLHENARLLREEQKQEIAPTENLFTTDR